MRMKLTKTRGKHMQAQALHTSQKMHFKFLVACIMKVKSYSKSQKRDILGDSMLFSLFYLIFNLTCRRRKFA